jgi:hypothetical protein
MSLSATLCRYHSHSMPTVLARHTSTALSKLSIDSVPFSLSYIARYSKSCWSISGGPDIASTAHYDAFQGWSSLHSGLSNQISLRSFYQLLQPSSIQFGTVKRHDTLLIAVPMRLTAHIQIYAASLQASFPVVLHPHDLQDATRLGSIDSVLCSACTTGLTNRRNATLIALRACSGR